MSFTHFLKSLVFSCSFLEAQSTVNFFCTERGRESHFPVFWLGKGKPTCSAPFTEQSPFSQPCFISFLSRVGWLCVYDSQLCPIGWLLTLRPTAHCFITTNHCKRWDPASASHMLLPSFLRLFTALLSVFIFTIHVRTQVSSWRKPAVILSGVTLNLEISLKRVYIFTLLSLLLINRDVRARIWSSFTFLWVGASWVGVLQMTSWIHSKVIYRFFFFSLHILFYYKFLLLIIVNQFYIQPPS